MSDKPNVLIIMADQLRADALGCYGNEVCRTPNIDALARSGVLFENSFTPNPICVPARASITTGNYSHRATGCKENSGCIHDDQPKLAEHFNRFGYRSYAMGKLHYVPYASPDQPRLVHGFDVWDSCESGRILQQYDYAGRRRGVEDYFDYLHDVGWHGFTRAHGIGNNDVRPCPSPLPEEHQVDAWVASRTLTRLREHHAATPDRPFLAFCSFPKPHSPYDPPARLAQMYDPRDVPAPFGDAEMLATRNPTIEHIRQTHAIKQLSPEAIRVIRAYYYGLVTFQDEQVGRVLAGLEEMGLSENTIVVYIADHGDLLGDFGGFFKCNFLEGSLRVPIILRAPGLPAGQRRGQLAGLQDILPTLATLTGCELDQDVDGMDMTPWASDAETAGRELYYAQCHESPRQAAMVTDGRWKYCRQETGGVEELYDLQEDPHELNNLALADRMDPTLAEWRARLIAEAKRYGDTALLSEDESQLRTSPLDRQAIRKAGIGGMGWRWY
ncbi:MAG: sulfatase [Planctomycetota bacterium]